MPHRAATARSFLLTFRVFRTARRRDFAETGSCNLRFMRTSTGKGKARHPPSSMFHAARARAHVFLIWGLECGENSCINAAAVTLMLPGGERRG